MRHPFDMLEWPVRTERLLGMRRELHTVKESLHRAKGWLDGLSYALLAEEWDETAKARQRR